VAENIPVKKFRVKNFQSKLNIDKNFQHQKLITLYIDYSIPKYFYFKVRNVNMISLFSSVDRRISEPV